MIYLLDEARFAANWRHLYLPGEYDFAVQDVLPSTVARALRDGEWTSYVAPRLADEAGQSCGAVLPYCPALPRQYERRQISEADVVFVGRHNHNAGLVTWRRVTCRRVASPT